MPAAIRRKITDKWYIVQSFENGEWVDFSRDDDMTMGEARTEFNRLYPFRTDKFRMIERIAAFRVVAEKDFSLKKSKRKKKKLCPKQP